MSYEKVNNDLDKAIAVIPKFTELVTQSVAMDVSASEQIVSKFEDNVTTRIARNSVVLNDSINLLTVNTLYTINRCYGFYSPSLVAIILGIVKVVSFVVKVVKAIVQSPVFKVIIGLHKLASALIPEYQKAVNKALGDIQKFSRQMGLTAAGFQHLFNAANTTGGIISGILGHDADGNWSNFLVKSAAIADKIADNCFGLANDPAFYMQELMFDKTEQDRIIVKDRWEGMTKLLTDTTNVTESIAFEIGEVVSELETFEASLPDFIKENIPKWIPDTLQRADSLINDYLLPGVQTLKNQLKSLNVIVDDHSNKLGLLAIQLGRPGSILKSVDAMTGNTYQNQISDIDDVTSRKFGQDATNEYEGMVDEINTLESIAEAMSAPTPQPEFLDIESPERAKVTGIVAEPYETWFVGDY